MTNGPSKKILAILIIIGVLLPQFSAFALFGDILNITQCALKNRLRQFLEGVIRIVVSFIKNNIKLAVCVAKGAVIFFFTGVSIRCGTQKTEEGGSNINAAKETVMDTVARCIARQALTRMVNGMLSIIREKGRDGGPTYVQNWRNFILQSQYRGEKIWRGLLYLGAYGDSSRSIPPLLCKHIRESSAFRSLQPREVRGLIDSRLQRRVGSLQEYLVKANCDPLVDANYETFQRDFNAGGGWDTWERLLQPQNNIYGAIELALDELGRQRQIEERADIGEVTGHGFTGKRGESALDSCLSVGIDGRCVIYKNIQTPGFTLGETLNATVKSELDWIVSVDEINELLTDMFFVMISRLGNLGKAELPKPPIELDPNIPENLSIPVDPEGACVDSCTQTFCILTEGGYDCSSAGSGYDDCVSACFVQPGGGGVCQDPGGTTADYIGSLQSAISTVITNNPNGIADALNTTANSFAFVDYVAQELQLHGFNATSNVLNGNDNPNTGDLIAVWESGDTTRERYDIVISSGAGDRPLRDAATTDYTGDILSTCVQ